MVYLTAFGQKAEFPSEIWDCLPGALVTRPDRRRTPAGCGLPVALVVFVMIPGVVDCGAFFDFLAGVVLLSDIKYKVFCP
jgi:hydrogenase maturation factor HypE